MPISTRSFRWFTRVVGALLALGGTSALTLFAVFLATGQSPLTGAPVGGDGLGLLVLATLGAFTLPLGIAVTRQHTGPLRVAAAAIGLMALLRATAMLSPEIRAVAGLVPLFEAVLLGTVAAIALWVRPEGEAPIELDTAVEIDAPAAAVWHVLAEQFGDVATYAGGLQASFIDGPVGLDAVRTCETKPFGPFSAATLTERLTRWSPEAMRFTYVAGGDLPPFIPASTNRWAIEPLGPNRCRAVSHASIELSWWAVPFATLLGASIRGEVERFGVDLKRHVENGLHAPA